MSAKVVDDPPPTALGEGETLIWQGPIGFNFMSSPVVVLVLLIASGYAFWATWGSYTASEFCLGASSNRGCSSLYWLLGPALSAATAGLGFDALERWMVTRGKRRGEVLLTDRRLMRVSEWPWQRIRSFNYLQAAPELVVPGVIRFGRSSVILATNDAKECLRIMKMKRKAAA